MAEVLVLVDHLQGKVKRSTYELLTAARALGEPAAVVVGPPGTVGEEIVRAILRLYRALYMMLSNAKQGDEREVSNMVTTPASEGLASWSTGMSPTVVSVLRRGYVEYRGLLAVVDVSGESTSYHELDRAVCLLVTGPRSHAVKGDPMAVHIKNRSEGFTIDYALAIGGFVRVALSGDPYSSQVPDPCIEIKHRESW